jgi:predicted DsbA family dithiol-disulfide isomerase
MVAQAIHLEIISDFACPWCLVGKRRLDRAIGQRPDLDIRVEWRPFQLNPDMPREGRNRRAYYSHKFGEERLNLLRQSLYTAGTEEGVIFCDTQDAVAPNTLSAHVLMLWATEVGIIDTHRLADKLLVAHHVACENIGDHEVLKRIAAEVGMDKAAVASKLATGEDEERAKEQIHQSLARGVSAVPFFIINQQYGISGAQPAQVLISAFEKCVSTV